MLALHTLFADTIIMTGNLFGWHFTVTLSELIYLIIAAVVGLVAEFLVGWRLPLGIVGAVIVALLGIWLMTHVIPLTIPGDPNIYGVPLLKALIGAIVLVAIWHLLTYRAWRPRRRVAA
ncbi:MAG TPA: hypothetical protein DHW02_24880 [Ktedonobacter sp.]|nr:hypothetical protein [Ktedonobacter sp.]